MAFPAYFELESRSNRQFACSSAIAIRIYTSALILTGVIWQNSNVKFCYKFLNLSKFISVLLFGEELRPDMLLNVATKTGWISVLVRIVYCLVQLFHLPFIFFSLKEYIIVMYILLQIIRIIHRDVRWNSQWIYINPAWALTTIILKRKGSF